MSDVIHTRIKNKLAFLALDRPRALNALSLAMVRDITDALLRWRADDGVEGVVLHSTSEKAFCAGGDIRFFHDAGKATPQAGSALLEDFFTEEYWLNYLIHHYPKPFIALMDGIVMGGGMGIAQCRSPWRMRVVTERTRMAMPEVNIGFFPDVGAGYFLSRAPGRTGTYLGLTGETVGAADALYADLADAYLPSQQLPALIDMLETCRDGRVHEQVRAFAAPFAAHADPASGSLARNRAAIDLHFAAEQVPAILASLAADGTPFAARTEEVMHKRSPLMMCVTLEQLRRAAGTDIGDCLRMERNLVRRSLEHGEVLEGIRALAVDKDHAPRWKPATLEDVTPEMIDGFFTPAWPAYAHPLRDLS